ncbi:TIGR00297 family protein [Haloplanus salinarum]
MGVTSTLRRAGGFAVVGTLALAAPELGRAAAAPFAIVALLAAFVVDEGPVFELFARPQDRRDGRLNGLAGFALAATGLALLSTIPQRSMPTDVFVAAVFVVAYGRVGARVVERLDTTKDPGRTTAGYGIAAFLAALVGQLAVGWNLGTPPALPAVIFLAAAGALVAALLRSILYARDDPLVMLSVGLLLWLFDAIGVDAALPEVGVALAVTVALGYLSYRTGTASVPGMVTGVLLALLTLVFGGVGWFAVLIAFFGIGGLSAKYRYEEKRSRGVAEDNEGARGSGNVLGNAAVALVAVIGFAASGSMPMDGELFRFAFTGSLAAAMSDTLSSEIGVLFDNPRLITTLKRVDPGTDGGITWQGYVVGVVGAAVVSGVAVGFFAFGSPWLAALAVVAGGVTGMTVDSLLGATLEGGRVGNQTVNFLGTFAGAVASAAFAALLL